jgi:predicted kinase
MLILISGSPLSGKSTLCKKIKKHFGDQSKLLSTDEFRKSMTGSYSDYSREYAIWADIVKIALKNLNEEKIVILDATLRQKDLRLKHLEYYKKYPIFLIAFEQIPIEVLLERNMEREEKKLPEERLRELWSGYEFPDDEELKLYEKSIIINNENSNEKIKELLDYIQERRKQNE